MAVRDLGWQSRRSRNNSARFLCFAVVITTLSTQAIAGNLPRWRTVQPNVSNESVLSARSGPGHNFPVVVQLAPGQTVLHVLSDPTGWSAVRTEEGQTVWIPTADLKQNTVPCNDIATEEKANSLPVQQIAADIPPPQPPVAGSASSDQFVRTAAALVSDEWRPASFSLRGVNPAPTRLPESNEPSHFGTLPAGQPREDPSSPNPASRSVSLLPSTTSELTARQTLDRAEAEFTRMLTRDPTEWDLKPIEDSLAYLTTRPLDSRDVARLKSLAERVAEARHIANSARSQQIASSVSPAVARSPMAAGLVGGWTASSTQPITSGGGDLTIIPPPPTRPIAQAPAPRPALAAWSGNPLAKGGYLPPPGVDDPGVSPASFVSPAPSNPLTDLRTPVEAPSQRPGDRPIPTREEIARELNELRRQRFDAVGRLVRAQVRRPTDPPYMVLNERGEIEAYLKPSPGTILRTYVGHQVGVTGRRIRTADGRGPTLLVGSVQLLDPPGQRLGASIAGIR